MTDFTPKAEPARLADAKYIVWVWWGDYENWRPVVCNTPDEAMAELMNYGNGGMTKLITKPVAVCLSEQEPK